MHHYPRRHGNIVKPSGKCTNDLYILNFETTKAMGREAAGACPPTESMLEGSPEARVARCEVNLSAEAVRKIMEGFDVLELDDSATTWYRREEVVKKSAVQLRA